MSDVSIDVGSVFLKQPNVESGGVISQTVPVLQDYADETYTIFAGVSVRDGEPVDDTYGSVIKLQNTGSGLARVLGPVSVGDSLSTAPDLVTGACLVKSNSENVSEGSMVVGVALQEVPEDEINLVRVQFGYGAASGAGIFIFKLQSHAEDTIACKTLDNVQNILIWKPYKLRYSIASESIDGTTYNYTYDTASLQSRTSDDGATTEDQKITPRYLVDDLIFAMMVDHPIWDIHQPPYWLDVNADGRAWAHPV